MRPATPPTATVDSCTGVTDHSLTCQASIDPNGPPVTRYHFEYSTDGSAWTSTPETLLGAQDDPQAVEETISPGTFGLDPNTAYHVRVSAGRKFADPVISNELIKTTAARAPLAETAGAPIRTTKMAQLNGRVTPFGSAANYHFEYGTQGPCGANPCASTSTQSAGSGQGMKLVAAQINGLSPDTTYHYRLVVDNGVGGAVAGSDMTATTRSTSDPLDGPAPHGAYPGPPHSDRAYELVSLPDTGGNPALLSFGLSNDGNRTLYNVAGGTPISGSGNITAFYASARPAGEHPSSDWQSSVITPGRELLIGSVWSDSTNSGDLSVTVAVNANGSGDGQRVLWRLSPFGAPVKLFEASSTKILTQSLLSDDGTRVVGEIKGGVLDPAFPTAATVDNFYEIGAGGDPQLASILPNGSPPACGLVSSTGWITPYMGASGPNHPLSADGSRLYFQTRGDDCGSEPQLYVRDLSLGQTTKISGSPVSGPPCGAGLIKSLPGEVFLWTQARLDPADTEPAACNGASATDGDIYRYDLSDQSLQCVTCVAGADADVQIAWPDPSVKTAISEDGSRVYFSTTARLTPEAPPSGTIRVYRVRVATGELAYVGPITADIGTTAAPQPSPPTAPSSISPPTTSRCSRWAAPSTAPPNRPTAMTTPTARCFASPVPATARRRWGRWASVRRWPAPTGGRWPPMAPTLSPPRPRSSPPTRTPRRRARTPSPAPTCMSGATGA